MKIFKLAVCGVKTMLWLVVGYQTICGFKIFIRDLMDIAKSKKRIEP